VNGWPRVQWRVSSGPWRCDAMRGRARSNRRECVCVLCVCMCEKQAIGDEVGKSSPIWQLSHVEAV